jgi:hypothetical protein
MLPQILIKHTQFVEYEPFATFFQIASMADIGYQVNFAGADLYGTAQINPACLCSTTGAVRHRSRNLLHVRALDGNSTLPLSPAVQEYVTAYGQARLQEYALPSNGFSGVLPPPPPPGLGAPGDSVIYVGDRYLAVIVVDQGRYYSVVVTN